MFSEDIFAGLISLIFIIDGIRSATFVGSRLRKGMRYAGLGVHEVEVRTWCSHVFTFCSFTREFTGTVVKLGSLPGQRDC